MCLIVLNRRRKKKRAFAVGRQVEQAFWSSTPRSVYPKTSRIISKFLNFLQVCPALFFPVLLCPFYETFSVFLSFLSTFFLFRIFLLISLVRPVYFPLFCSFHPLFILSSGICISAPFSPFNRKLREETSAWRRIWEVRGTSYEYRPNRTPLSHITVINHMCYTFRGLLPGAWLSDLNSAFYFIGTANCPIICKNPINDQLGLYRPSRWEEIVKLRLVNRIPGISLEGQLYY